MALPFSLSRVDKSMIASRPQSGPGEWNESEAHPPQPATSRTRLPVPRPGWPSPPTGVPPRRSCSKWEPAMHRAVLAESRRPCVPRTLRPKTKKGPVQNRSPVAARPRHRTRRSVRQQHRFEDGPPLVRDRPNRRQHPRLPLLQRLRQPWCSSARLTERMARDRVLPK